MNLQPTFTEIALPDIFCRIEREFERYPVLRPARPSSLEELGEIESFFGSQLPLAYRNFLLVFGGGFVESYPIYGSVNAEPMDAQLWHVVEVTKAFRQQHWPGADSALVVSEDLTGNPIYLTKDGAVETYDHDFGKHARLASSFEEFLLQCLLDLYVTTAKFKFVTVATELEVSTSLQSRGLTVPDEFLYRYAAFCGASSDGFNVYAGSPKEDVSVERFLDVRKAEDLALMYEGFADFKAPELLPFAISAGGNYVCVHVLDGSIWFADHDRCGYPEALCMLEPNIDVFLARLEPFSLE